MKWEKAMASINISNGEKTSEILAGEYKYCPRCGSKMEVFDDGES